MELGDLQVSVSLITWAVIKITAGPSYDHNIVDRVFGTRSTDALHFTMTMKFSYSASCVSLLVHVVQLEVVVGLHKYSNIKLGV